MADYDERGLELIRQRRERGELSYNSNPDYSNYDERGLELIRQRRERGDLKYNYNSD